jgi:hypothetical protein
VQSGGKVTVFTSIQIPFYLRDTSDKFYCSVPNIKSAFIPKDFYFYIIPHGVSCRKRANRILRSATHIPIVKSASIYLGGRNLYNEGCTVCIIRDVQFV